MIGRRSLELKTAPQLQAMQRAGVVLSEALDATLTAAAPGVTTAELDAVFAGVLAERGATSNFLGYYDFPASICTSVNDEVVHGIPGDRVLQTGDVLKLSLIHISEPTRQAEISYAVFCLRLSLIHI